MPILKNQVLFIINPNSGKERNKKAVKFLQEQQIDYFVTRDIMDFEQVMKENINKYKAFVAVGGDGTVNALANCLIDQEDKALAILPSGSGNGFANELGFKLRIKDLMDVILKFELQKVDVLTINRQIFFNVAGIGLDAAIAHQFQRSKKRGFLNYLLSTIHTYFSFSSFDATIVIEKRQYKGRFKLISIANTRQFGNNALISPRSSPVDRKYELVLVKHIPLYKVIPFAYRLFAGTLKSDKYIQYLEVSGNANIETNCQVYHFDGDPRTRESDGNYTTSISKHFLSVICTTQDAYIQQ